MEPSNFQNKSLILEQISKKRSNISPIKYKIDDSEVNFILKDHRDKLISKRKEFIKNYRKKQRLLTSIEPNQSNTNSKTKNIYNEEIIIEDIKYEIDPVSRIKLLKIYIFKNQTKINMDFINDNIHLLRECFKDFKKYLFDYDNKNINKQIQLNICIIYNILSILFEPEINPIMEEIDSDFLIETNKFCFYYLKLNNDKIKDNIKDNIVLYVYILFLLNNLVTVYPDEEMIKFLINIKEIINIYYEKFLPMLHNNTHKKNNNNTEININNYNIMKKLELLEFSFLKLIENCIAYLHLEDNDIRDLLLILLPILKNKYYNNNIKLLIYNLESLAAINHSNVLFENDFYNNFLVTLLNDMIINFKNNNHNIDLILLIYKLFLELYLQRLLVFVEFSYFSENIIIKNIDLFFKENLIIFFKDYLYYFYKKITLNNNNNNAEIKKLELKILIKVLKIFTLYFRLITDNNNDKFIYFSVKNKIEKILCSLFILNDKINIQLDELLINIFKHFVDLDDKNSNKICTLIIDLFKYIYTPENIQLNNDNNGIINHYSIFELKKYLIDTKNIHRSISPYLDEEKYPFLIEIMLNLIRNILFFCEELDKFEKGKNYIFEKIKQELKDLYIFDKIENIECDSYCINIKNLAEDINNNYFRTSEKIEQFS